MTGVIVTKLLQRSFYTKISSFIDKRGRSNIMARVGANSDRKIGGYV